MLKSSRMSIVCFIFLFILPRFLFASFEFANKSSNLVLMDSSSSVSLHSQAAKSWEELSVIRNRDNAELSPSSVAYSIENLNCDLMFSNSDAIIAGSAGGLGQTAVQNLIDASITSTMDEAYDLIVANSDAIDSQWDLILANSNAIDGGGLGLTQEQSDLLYANSNAIDSQWDLILDNSNAIIAGSAGGLGQTAVQNLIDASITSTMDEAYDDIQTMSEYQWDLIVDNSNAIVNGGAGGLGEPAVQALIDASVTSTMDELYSNIQTMSDYFEDRIATFSGSTVTVLLLSGNVCENLTLDQHVFVHSTKDVHITSSIIIDGDGATLIFADNDSNSPQFIIDDNISTTIKNIRLHNLQNSTFKMYENSELCIGENVTFELGEDVAFNDGAMQVIDDGSGANTFIVRGIGGKKIFTIEPSNPLQKDRGTRDEPYNRYLNIGDNHIEFQDIDFDGVSDVTHESGKIKFAGNCSALIDEDTDANFEIRGITNEFRFIENNLTLKGAVTFGEVSNNLLHINCVISEHLTTAPVINLEGDCIVLSSGQGKAGIIFDNEMITVNNEEEDSFILGEHSFLNGKYVEITGEPIKQTSSDVELGSDLVLEHASASAIAPDSVPLLSVITRWYESVDFDEMACEQHRAINIAGQDIVYSYNTIYLGNAAGSVLLNHAIAKNFNINATYDLNLWVAHESRVEQGDSNVELKADDTLTVSGKNNVIEVNKQLTLSGSVVLGTGSELIFEFNDKAINPSIIFSKDITLPANSKIEFRGNGTVTFDDDVEIIFTGAASTKPKFVLSDHTVMQLESGGSTLQFKGKGKILILDGARLSVGDGDNVIIGDSTSDYIDIEIARDGLILIEGDSQTSRLSIHKTECTLDIKQGGAIYIGGDGEFELNALAGVVSSGKLNQFALDVQGTLYVASGGKVVIGNNSSLLYTAAWDSLFGVISGSGLIKFVHVTDSFTGVLQSSLSYVNFKKTTGSLDEIVGGLVNTNNDLLVSYAFVDENGNNVVRTSENVLITLVTGESVVSDTASGNVRIFSEISGRYKTYDALGNRI